MIIINIIVLLFKCLLSSYKTKNWTALHNNALTCTHNSIHRPVTWAHTNIQISSSPHLDPGVCNHCLFFLLFFLASCFMWRKQLPHHHSCRQITASYITPCFFVHDLKLQRKNFEPASLEIEHALFFYLPPLLPCG